MNTDLINMWFLKPKTEFRNISDLALEIVEIRNGKTAFLLDGKHVLYKYFY